MKIHVFDVDQLSRRVLDPSWPILAAKSAKNDPNLAPQDDPKSTKNRCQKTIEILIANKTNLAIHFGRSGGMRWPPGGILGGSKNTLQVLNSAFSRFAGLRLAYYALRYEDLACGLGIWQVIWHAQTCPSGAGGGFKRSTHSASPALDISSLAYHLT